MEQQSVCVVISILRFLHWFKTVASLSSLAYAQMAIKAIDRNSFIKEHNIRDGHWENSIKKKI